ncbi:MAG TPA: hypothetical protein VM842_04210 [Nitrospira sp.]|nr:hypothetical protein [Nitrospira sp.]
MIGLLVTASLLLAMPVAAADDDHLAFSLDLEQIVSEVLEKNTPETLLRGMFEKAIEVVRDHVEVEGRLPSEAASDAGEFRLKLFPQGKSRSQEHVTAEGSFNLAPDADQQQLILRFKSSKPPLHPLPHSGEIL